MWSRLIVLCFCAQFFRPAYSICTVSKYSEGYGDWVKCGAATVAEALKKGGPVLAAITISQSRIPNILENAFVNHPSLQALTLQNCGIREVHPNAFSGLRSLKKLNMPNNNISRVEPNWFVDLVLLEQLDLSFNLIRDIDALAIARLTNLRRLNLDDNSLTCLDPKDMEPMRSIAKIRVLENPLSLTCRGRMTLWFHDKGINYSSGLAVEEPESWLDRVLWLCAEDGYGKTRSEKTMRECVALNIFNQLRLALKTSDSYPISAQQCRPQTQAFMKCIAKSGREPGVITNGEAMTNIVLAMRAAQEEMKIN